MEINSRGSLQYQANKTIEKLVKISLDIDVRNTIIALINSVDNNENTDQEPHLNMIKEELIYLSNKKQDGLLLLNELQRLYGMSNHFVLLIIYQNHNVSLSDEHENIAP